MCAININVLVAILFTWRIVILDSCISQHVSSVFHRQLFPQFPTCNIVHAHFHVLHFQSTFPSPSSFVGDVYGSSEWPVCLVAERVCMLSQRHRRPIHYLAVSRSEDLSLLSLSVSHRCNRNCPIVSSNCSSRTLRQTDQPANYWLSQIADGRI